MILNDITIKQLNLVKNAKENSFRSASYDLTIGKIITPYGDPVDERILPPQGVVKVISNESVEIPPHITGYVHVKTHLCNQGVLALNIGIVDPGFSGPLQSTLINFGKIRHRIRKGETFGRITFHEQNNAGSKTTINDRSMDDVIHAAKHDVDVYLAPDFLDFNKTVTEAAKKATDGYKEALIKYLPFIAILLAGLTYFLNFANMSRLEGYINVKDRAADVQERQELRAALVKLATKSDALEAELAQIRQASRPSASEKPARSNPNMPTRHE
jgi:deoxycytidine triphosphate deaminase